MSKKAELLKTLRIHPSCNCCAMRPFNDAPETGRAFHVEKTAKQTSNILPSHLFTQIYVLFKILVKQKYKGNRFADLKVIHLFMRKSSSHLTKKTLVVAL